MYKWPPSPSYLSLFIIWDYTPTGEKMALNVFEPRYRLMIRRAMEGNRRFGMAQGSRGRDLDEVFIEVRR